MNKKALYEIIFAVLALYAVCLAFADIVDKIPKEYETIYLDKKAYFKDNIFELLSIIPLDSFFRGFRIFRIIRIIRVILLSKRSFGRFSIFLKTNGFIYVLIITIVTVFAGAAAIYKLEYDVSMKSFGDALWWSFVTVTTVGYGDLSPMTGGGRIVAAILMIVGIGFVGMLTGTIATFFISAKNKSIIRNENQILDLSGLEHDKYVQVKDFYEYIKNK